MMYITFVVCVDILSTFNRFVSRLRWFLIFTRHSFANKSRPSAANSQATSERRVSATIVVE